MPILGVGLHILIALYFAVHAVRSGRDMYWLLVLFCFPLLGSVVYFFAIYLPQSRLDQAIARAGRSVLGSLDPGRALREAREAFDLTPTAQNQTRLAGAMLDAGMTAEAAQQYEACLQGPFGSDPDIRFGAAQALLANAQAGESARMLTALRASHPAFHPEKLSLLLARAYSTAGRKNEAAAEFAHLVERFPGVETRVAYAVWALEHNEPLLADEQCRELGRLRKQFNNHTRSLHAELFKKLDAALKTHRQ
ncbi:PLDc N-terminal domain-containing protein [Massilia violaceinigra]|uniref:PLDc N-terminal domain-containing protein n=2 Tax=Massilia violaceinigra TaxID=2045208 RepID=A0ABY4A2R6_9BURK|nr:PLDc N-terminal domain-containing protein [Massilia violaceinigra]